MKGTPVAQVSPDVLKEFAPTGTLRAAINQGNTVLVVEHKPETIAIADHVVDLGPGAGTAGGVVCFEGTVAELRASSTSPGQHFGYRASVKDAVRSASGVLEVRGASAHNLRDVDVEGARLERAHGAPVSTAAPPPSEAASDASAPSSRSAAARS